MHSGYKEYFGDIYDNAIDVQPNNLEQLFTDQLFDKIWLYSGFKDCKTIFDAFVIVATEIIDMRDIEKFEQKCWDLWYASEEENNNV